MKIAILAPFEESVPPQKYGGTELIIYYLCQILPKKHSVFLFATGDSKTKARLMPIFPRSIRKEKISQDMKFRESLKYIGLAKVVKELKKIKIDIIHNHIGWRFLPYASLFDCPTVTTLHGPLDVPYHQFVYGQFRNLPYISISNSQRKPLKLNYVATVYNGIDIKQLEFNDKPKRDYLAFLGRMSPEKGPVQAIEIARKSGLELRMAAKVDIVDREFFKKKVKPLIDNKKIKFLGEVSNKEKINLLKNAKALLCPLQWEEPFGLFIVEAMACGTPVIVFDRGSARELVINGETGFIVKNVGEAVKAVENVDKIDRKKCRERVEKKFTAEKMVDEYEKVYFKILNSKKQ